MRIAQHVTIRVEGSRFEAAVAIVEQSTRAVPSGQEDCLRLRAHHSLRLGRIERAEIERVIDSLRATGCEEEAAAIGKKRRATMRVFAERLIQVRQRRHLSASVSNPEQRLSITRSEDDDAL